VFQLRPVLKDLLPILNAFLLYPDGTVCLMQVTLLCDMVECGIFDDIGPQLRSLCEQIYSHPERFLCESCCPYKPRDVCLADLSVQALGALPGSVCSVHAEQSRLKFCQLQDKGRAAIKQCCNPGCSKKGSDAGVTLMRCACDTELYCSEECQRVDWRARHKNTCTKRKKGNRPRK